MKKKTDKFSTLLPKPPLPSLDARAVRRDAERGEKVIDEIIGLIRGTKLDTGTYLDKLIRLKRGVLARSGVQRLDGRDDRELLEFVAAEVVEEIAAAVTRAAS